MLVLMLHPDYFSVLHVVSSTLVKIGKDAINYKAIYDAFLQDHKCHYRNSEWWLV